MNQDRDEVLISFEVDESMLYTRRHRLAKMEIKHSLSPGVFRWRRRLTINITCYKMAFETTFFFWQFYSCDDSLSFVYFQWPLSCTSIE